MSLLRPRVQKRDSSLASLVPPRSASRTGSVSVNPESALYTSAVWAALTLRANLVSTFPIDVLRPVGGLNVEVPKPPVLIDPAGDGWGINDWMWATQFDLDRVGNCYGVITKKSGSLPAEVQLVDHKTVTVLVSKSDGTVTYRIGQKVYQRDEIWHERANPVPGLVMGLSPVAYAAWSIGMYQSAQQFALEWFANGAQVPSGHFRNTVKTLLPEEADVVKRRAKETVQSGDFIVTGNDWEFKTVDSASKDAQFLESQEQSEVDIARYFGVPASAIDVNASGENVTYANLSQDNLRLLVLHLQPAVTRREKALSRMVADPRFVKLNTEALLRMDPKTKAEVNAIKIRTGQSTPDQARAYDNQAPLSEADYTQLERLGLTGAASIPTNGEAA